MRSWQQLIRKLFALQSGPAHRVIFYYFGEDPTYLEDAYVTVFRNGVVEIQHRNEHVSTHAQNVEILWKGRGSTGHKGRHLSLIKNEPPKSNL
jgi:hypothetical protein